MVTLFMYFIPAHLEVAVHRALAVDLALPHFLDPLASWGPALAVVAAVGVGPARIARAVVVACALAIVAAVSHSRHCSQSAVADAARIRPADHCSSHHPSRAARIRADRSRNRSTAGRTGCRSLHTAAVPAARGPDRSIAAAAAAAVVVVAAAGGRRNAAGMPWRRGVRYRISGSAKPHAPGTPFIVE